MKNLINLTYKEKNGVIECNEFEFYLIIAMDSNFGHEYVIVDAADYYIHDRSTDLSWLDLYFLSINVINSFATLESAKEWLHNEIVEIVQRLFGVK